MQPFLADCASWPVDAKVLITGEHRTGKEIAQAASPLPPFQQPAGCRECGGCRGHLESEIFDM